ncbi:putative reverse transcriptase zinc-binding domain-containing protein [Helianthus annuus]|nr:putative reverse transcriptase zinc-binding domain-containing protein [Helianthus annuus]
MVLSLLAWEWKTYPSSIIEVNNLIEVHRKLAVVCLQRKEDSWVWNQWDKVDFSVKETRKWLRSNDLTYDSIGFSWCKWLPNKCNIFMWRANTDRIPTQSALRKRNICVGDGLCPLCGDAEETSDHLFSACRVACGVWMGISTSCKISPFLVFSTNDILQLVNYLGGSDTIIGALYGVLIIACWRI